MNKLGTEVEHGLVEMRTRTGRKGKEWTGWLGYSVTEPYRTPRIGVFDDERSTAMTDVSGVFWWDQGW